MINIRYFIYNGFYIPFLIALFTYNDFLLFFFSSLKLLSTNFYFNFQYCNKPYYYWKHMIRLTDTGHIANMIYYFNPDFLPIAFNIHFIIAVGYWSTRICFNLNESVGTPEHLKIMINEPFSQFLRIANHSFSLFLYTYILWKSEMCYEHFNNDTLLYTYYWCHSWLFLIYLPWRFLTHDPVYSVLSNDSPFYISLLIFVYMHFVAYFSNYIGYYITC